MENKSEKAMALHRQGYNCAQSVCGAFCEEMGVDFDTAIKMSSSFGSGMGGLREVCGAVSGMFLVEGMINGFTNPKDSEAKKSQNKRVQHLAAKFREENPSIVCRELLTYNGKMAKEGAAEGATEYYKKRPCVELVGFAAGILENELTESQSEEPEGNKE